MADKQYQLHNLHLDMTGGFSPWRDSVPDSSIVKPFLGVCLVSASLMVFSPQADAGPKRHIDLYDWLRIHHLNANEMDLEDLDQDGLSSRMEFELDTDPRNADTDLDGVPDGWDFLPLNDVVRSPSDLPYFINPDDVYQLSIRFPSADVPVSTHMQKKDTDGDGLPDYWERLYDLNPYGSDGIEVIGDLDNDGLSNIQEFFLGTRPDRSDTDVDGHADNIDRFPLHIEYCCDNDNDGLPNAYELTMPGLDPNFPFDALEDFDQDGWQNNAEFKAGTHPHLASSDGEFYNYWTNILLPDSEDVVPLDYRFELDGNRDGIPVEWLVGFWQDEYESVNRAFEDFDGDGLIDLLEFRFMAHPTDNLGEMYRVPYSFDSDGDGILDGEDIFPMDSWVGLDDDGDGIPTAYEMWVYQEYRTRLLNNCCANPDEFPVFSYHDDQDSQMDFDGDGLNNYQEYQYGTHPYLADSDYDSVDDAQDLWPNDPSKARDSDGDGLPDAWEILNYHNPFVHSANEDLDQDGLTAFAEYLAGTSELTEDFDGDGLTDIDDRVPTHHHIIVPVFDEFYVIADGDRDGLVDWQEDLRNTNPMSPDTDNDGEPDYSDKAPLNPQVGRDFDTDGLPDDFEGQYGLNHLLHDHRHDLDFDGLSNLVEFELGLDPRHPDTDRDGIFDDIDVAPLSPFRYDTDRDGMPDAWENYWGLDPLNPFDARQDDDADGYINVREFTLDQSPQSADSPYIPLLISTVDMFFDKDSDGMSDEWEQQNGLSPFDKRDAEEDKDHDGLTNISEFFHGSNPNNPDSNGDGISDFDEHPINLKMLRFSLDSDRDGAVDSQDAFPQNPNEWLDSDGDGVGDNSDAFPLDSSETLDSDGDGVGNNRDAFPFDPNETRDSDGDRVGDNADVFPNDRNEWLDTDGDGVGDNADAFPLDPSETRDTDGDGIGDNSDPTPEGEPDESRFPLSFDFTSQPDANQNWSYYSSTNQGSIRIDSGQLLMDVSTNGTNNLNEAIWTVDLTRASSVVLSFFQADFGDEHHRIPMQFTGHTNADGVAISRDGNLWYALLIGQEIETSATGKNYIIDIDAAVARIQTSYDSTFTLGEQTKIKFQQYDNYGKPTDGRGWDNIQLEAVVSDIVIASLQSRDVVIEPGQPTSGCEVYPLTNMSTESHSWKVDTSQFTWLSAPIEGGELLPGGSTDVFVCWDAAEFSEGDYQEAYAVFTDTSGTSERRAEVNVRMQTPNTSLPFNDGFSSSSLGEHWQFYSSSSVGRIAVSAGRLTMDVSSNGRFSLNEAILTLDLANLNGVQLSFFQLETSDENHSMTAVFDNHHNSDGVAISADGIRWYRIVSTAELDVGASGQRYTIDLDAEITRIQASYDASFSYTNNFKIKFQQYDNYSASTDGRKWDDVSVMLN